MFFPFCIILEIFANCLFNFSNSPGCYHCVFGFLLKAFHMVNSYMYFFSNLSCIYIYKCVSNTFTGKCVSLYPNLYTIPIYIISFSCNPVNVHKRRKNVKIAKIVWIFLPFSCIIHTQILPTNVN